MEKTFVRNLSLNQLTEWITSRHQPAYRAKQLYHWLWNKNIRSIDQINNLPKSFRTLIEEELLWDSIQIQNIQQSTDKTIKAAFTLYDSSIVEGVIIPSEDRATACISTQVGCPVRCAFCATGTMGFLRNLNTGEIIDQIVLLNQLAKERINQHLTNIVIMGMGEPFLNYDHTIKALRILTSPTEMNWSAQRITLSTVGLPDAIEQFATEQLGVSLAVSLHSAIQEKRQQLIPIAKKYPLDQLIKSLKTYTKISKKPVTIEYLLLNDINDSVKDAQALVRICSSFHSKVNLIPYNKVEHSPFKPSDENKIYSFYNYLKVRNIQVRIRKSRGNDIEAACGQLANKILKK